MVIIGINRPGVGLICLGLFELGLHARPLAYSLRKVSKLWISEVTGKQAFFQSSALSWSFPFKSTPQSPAWILPLGLPLSYPIYCPLPEPGSDSAFSLSALIPADGISCWGIPGSSPSISLGRRGSAKGRLGIIGSALRA